MNQKEKLFFDKLKDIFIGAKIEGDSGFINLMRIKSAYFDVIFKELIKEIKEKTKEFPEFKEEMFDKLYSFFKTYFSESGSIYFSYTPLKSKIYERVYTNQKDVALFWKTHMLYYVKTDKLWNNLTIDFDEDGISYKVHFDVSKLEHKKSNEKKKIIYELKNVKGKEITFIVLYSERGKKTKIAEILRTFKKKKIWIDEERLKKIFRIFEKQNEVDFFINKNAEAFLKEQFDLWLKNYLFDDETDFREERLKQLKVLKDIAYKVIDFVAQFEDELVKIWNKPKFVLNSNYVITLDRIAKKKDGINVIEKIIKHKGFENQVKEWKELGILKEFNKKKLFTTTLKGKELNKEYQFLPIDTKYFDESIKLKILSLFDNLDEELDGWLIHSENYQALKTILPKFQEKVQMIYIDPPYNTGSDEFIYNDRFQHASWLTMMENRISLASAFLKKRGVFFSNIADNAHYYHNSYKLNLLFDYFFSKRIGEIIWKRRSGAGSNTITDITEIHEKIFCYGFNETRLNKNILSEKQLKEYKYKDRKGLYKWNNTVINQYTKGQRPNLYYSIIYNLKEDKLVFDRDFIINPNEEVKIYPSESGNSVFFCDKNSMYEISKRGILKVFREGNKYVLKIKKYLYDKDGLIQGNVLKSVLDKEDTIFKVGGTSQGTKELKNLFKKEVFKKPKPSSLISILLYISTKIKNRDLILDFFAGSGTTAHAVMKLNKDDGGNRKFILIEMADYFNTVIIPRIKKISYSFNWKDGKPQDADGIGIFFKYFDLEQYEQTLKKAVYKPSHPFVVFSDKTIYQQYVFLKDLKLLEAMELDYKNNKIKIDFSKIYPNIDLAETISCITGKSIKRIEKDAVVLEDNERIKFNNIDFNLIKPLIWW